jgi:hypothetical protein
MLTSHLLNFAKKYTFWSTCLREKTAPLLLDSNYVWSMHLGHWPVVRIHILNSWSRTHSTTSVNWTDGRTDSHTSIIWRNGSMNNSLRLYVPSHLSNKKFHRKNATIFHTSKTKPNETKEISISSDSG